MIDDSDVDHLFNLPPEEFTAARNRLARQARKAGRTDLAIRLEGLRKPTAVVWIANQIARQYPGDVVQLLDASRSLRHAQEGALRGGTRAPVGAESAEWRKSLSAVIRRGREIARSGGRRSFDEARLSSTLLGAAAREESANLLRQGRLLTEIQPPGLEELFGDVPLAPRRAGLTGGRRRREAGGKAEVRPATRGGKRDESEEQRSRERRDEAAGRTKDEARRRKQEDARRRRQSARELARLRHEASRAAGAAEKARRDVRLNEERVARGSERLNRSRDALAEAEKRAIELRERITALEREPTLTGGE